MRISIQRSNATWVVISLLVALPLACSAPTNQEMDAGSTGGGSGGGATGSGGGLGGGAGGGAGGGTADGGHDAGSTDAGTDAGLPDGGRADAGPQGVPFVYVVGDYKYVRVYALDAGTGALIPQSSNMRSGGPNFLAFAKNKRTAYISIGSTVEALAINPSTGALTYLNGVPSGGAGAVHVFTESSGKYVLVANYSGGTASVLPILDGGALGPATDTVDAGVEAHQIVIDPSNRYAFVPCKGDDRVAQFVFDADNGTLTPNAVPYVNTANGAGPRHLAFHPNGTLAYLINETDSTLTAMTFDSGTGVLTPFQTVSTLVSPVSGNSTAEVEVHPNGKFVFGSNRGHNSIVRFSIGDGGTLALLGHTSTGGMTPRHFSIDPTGTLLFAANQNSDTVHAFRIDPSTGSLTSLGEVAQPMAPSFVGAIYLP